MPYPSMRSTLLGLAIASSCLTPLALAVPAAPIPLTLTQPDGRTLQAWQVGDEWCNGLQDDAGQPLVQSPKGFWQPASPPVLASRGALVPQGVCQANPWQLSSRGGLAGLRSTPTDTDAVPTLVILVSFSNRAGTYTEADFASLVFDDISPYITSVSLGKHWLEAAAESSGTLNNGVVGWLPLSYAHPNTGTSITSRNRQVSRDALVAADRYVNFAAFDQNGDRYVSAQELTVMVVAAGYERAIGRYSPSVWAHTWWFDPGTAPVLDGVTVGDWQDDQGGYVQVGEIHRSKPANAHRATNGIVAHELGHLIFRLPDLYDLDSSSNGAGAYCLMSYGAWGQASSDPYAGQTPVVPSAWIRQQLGWIVPGQGSGVAKLSSAGLEGGDPSLLAWRAVTGRSTEYFLLENRQLVGYDAGLYGLVGNAGGLAVWHVDETRTDNDNDAARLVDLEEADGGTSAYAASSLWYAGNPNQDETFGLSSSPSSRYNDGTSSGITLSSFSASAPTMSASVTLSAF